MRAQKARQAVCEIFIQMPAPVNAGVSNSSSGRSMIYCFQSTSFPFYIRIIPPPAGSIAIIKTLHLTDRTEYTGLNEFFPILLWDGTCVAEFPLADDVIFYNRVNGGVRVMHIGRHGFFNIGLCFPALGGFRQYGRMGEIRCRDDYRVYILV